MMIVLKHYESFNQRRYGNPWVAKVDAKTAKPDFNVKVGGYTGGYNRGEEGDLYISDPQDGAVYMYGQKDYRGNNTEREYALFKDGTFIPVAASTLIAVLNGRGGVENGNVQSTGCAGNSICGNG